MPWLAQHPDATERHRIPAEDGPEFELGFWPPLPEIEIRARIPVIDKPEVDASVDPEAFIEQAGLTWELCRDAARWSVRGWTDEGSLPPKFDEVEMDGRKYRVLSDESVGVLRRSGLLLPVAMKAIVLNLLTEQKKRAFVKSSASGSQNQGTPAPGAAKDSQQKTTEASLGSVTTSGGKTVPST